jgi:Zn-dependent protease
VRWSLQIARIHGIAIRVHVSFLLVLPLLAPLFAAQLQAAARAMELPAPGTALPPLVWGVLMTLGLFAAVLLLELAHALYAVAHGG